LFISRHPTDRLALRIDTLARLLPISAGHGEVGRATGSGKCRTIQGSGQRELNIERKSHEINIRGDRPLSAKKHPALSARGRYK